MATFRALVGINYVSEETGNEKRANAGDKITDMSENAARHEMAANHIEEWVDGQTENVQKPEDQQPEVEGVRSRRNRGEIRVKEVGE